MKTLILGLIRGYQKLEPTRNAIYRNLHLSTGICRFTPRCSEYTYQAIEKYGTLKGSWMGFKRIIHCNPWNKGKIDPVQ